MRGRIGLKGSIPTWCPWNLLSCHWVLLSTSCEQNMSPESFTDEQIVPFPPPCKPQDGWSFLMKNEQNPSCQGHSSLPHFCSPWNGVDCNDFSQRSTETEFSTVYFVTLSHSFLFHNRMIYVKFCSASIPSLGNVFEEFHGGDKNIVYQCWRNLSLIMFWER